MAINCGGPGFNLSREFLLQEARPQLLALANRLQGPDGMAAANVT
jgi:hypothetical protein